MEDGQERPPSRVRLTAEMPVQDPQSVIVRHSPPLIVCQFLQHLQPFSQSGLMHSLAGRPLFRRNARKQCLPLPVVNKSGRSLCAKWEQCRGDGAPPSSHSLHPHLLSPHPSQKCRDALADLSAPAHDGHRLHQWLPLLPAPRRLHTVIPMSSFITPSLYPL